MLGSSAFVSRKAPLILEGGLPRPLQIVDALSHEEEVELEAISASLCSGSASVCFSVATKLLYQIMVF